MGSERAWRHAATGHEGAHLLKLRLHCHSSRSQRSAPGVLPASCNPTAASVVAVCAFLRIGRQFETHAKHFTSLNRPCKAGAGSPGVGPRQAAPGLSAGHRLGHPRWAASVSKAWPSRARSVVTAAPCRRCCHTHTADASPPFSLLVLQLAALPATHVATRWRLCQLSALVSMPSALQGEQPALPHAAPLLH